MKLTISETEVRQAVDGCLKHFRNRANYGQNDVNCSLALFIKFGRVDNNALCPVLLVSIHQVVAQNVKSWPNMCILW